MTKLLWINHVLIVLFALSSGIFKVLGGEADIEVFSHLGMTPTAVAGFGAVQALGGAMLVFGRTAVVGTGLVVSSNTLATIGLLAAGVIPFGLISTVFIAMAALELGLDRAGLLARPGLPAPPHLTATTHA